MSLHIISAILLIAIARKSPLTNYFLNLTIGFFASLAFATTWAWAETLFYGPSLNYFLHLAYYLATLTIVIFLIHVFWKKK